MIKHIVMWRFSTEEERNEAKTKLETLPPVISEIIDFEVGVNFNKSDAAFDLVLYSTFESEDSLNAYQVHTAHKEVAEYIKAHATARAVGDYIV